ncbi:MAG TPA: dCTP deaminase, partial [Acidimicrobiia bacterium]
MIFSDRSILEAIDAGVIQIDPFEPSHVQPSSVDLRVGNGFRVFVNHRYSQIDPRSPQADLTQLVEVEADEPFMLHPGEFVLGS